MFNYFPKMPVQLLGATAIVLVTSQNANAQKLDCTLVNGALPEGCVRYDADTVIAIPVGKNTELVSPAPVAATGFAISLDGKPISGDKRLVDTVRRADVALAAADIQVKFDGLGAEPRLDLLTVGERRVFHTGDHVIFQSQTNYPRWLTRGEVRIIELSERGGPRTVAVLPINPNGQAQYVLPEGKDLVAIHRVYDSKGRYDETYSLALSARSLGDGGDQDGPQTSEPEEGTDRTSRRRIPVHGGAITVRGTSVAPGAMVQVMGETLRADPNGRFELNRIVPAGTHSVPVKISNGADIVRVVDIPRSDWFYVGIADLTVGVNDSEITGSKESYQTGRLGFYLKGRTNKGYTITASADTGEDDLSNLFRNFDERDPRSLLLRLDPDDLYPTYGDDSTLVEDAPTSGKFYLKVERDNNFALWGNYRARVSGGYYLRNERTLYGAQAEWAAQNQTENGDARVAVSLYAAQPDNLPQRDVFRGTGGSVYFLRRQDISIGSETLTIEIRDSDTGRVIERRTLIFGQDYDINYIQGVVTLSTPLNSSGGGGLVVTDPSGEADINLVAQYEFTPTASTLDGYASGGRVEGWIHDHWRVGVTGMVEKTGAADQTAISADILYRYSEGTFAKLEFARTRGPGFSSSVSSDGGLIIDDQPVASGDGEAVRAEMRVDMADLGMAVDGHIAAYFENRKEGFATLDYQVLAATGGETLWGIDVGVVQNERLSWDVYYDDYSNAVGEHKREGGLELTYEASDRVAYAFGIEHVDRNTGIELGDRTDAALKVTFTPNDQLSYYVFGQATLGSSSLGNNDRLGAGLSYDMANGWSVEGEVSDGTKGAGGKALLSYKDGDDRSLYFGYELAPGRELTGVTLSGRDRGRFVVGGRRRINDSLLTFGENSYDIFGDHQSLTSAYGVEYGRSDSTTYTMALEHGSINDRVNGDFNRQALSLGVQYHDENMTAQGRMELRRERGVIGVSNRDVDSYLLTASAKYKFNEEQRLEFSLDAAKADAFGGAPTAGDLVDVALGYAYRPIENDRLNVLLRYRYLYDMYGQKIDGLADVRPRQKSHVFSVDADYDLNERWSLGAKLGVRLSETSPDSTAAFSQNDAMLVIMNARYHLVHNWDILIEARSFTARQARTTDFGFLAAAYRHMGNNVKLGVGYNFGKFTDDITDLTQDDKGLFINLIAKF